MLHRSGLHLCALALLTPVSLASTWIVDDDGGPGVDFTSITAAVAAASSGDVILVRPGTYSGFTLNHAAKILGQPGASVTSPVTLSGIPAGGRATLVSLALRSLQISNCLAPVTVEDLTLHALPADVIQGSVVRISNSDDVRFRGVTILPTASDGNMALGMFVSNSRLELGAATVTGGHGIACGPAYPGFAQPGAPAIRGVGGADVHAARSTVTGGNGGDWGGTGCPSSSAGNGGPAILLEGGATAIVAGLTANLIHGGSPGFGNSCSEDGVPGAGIVVTNGTLRVSGVTIAGADPYPGCGGPSPDIVGPYTQAVPADPTIDFSGSPSPGALLTFTMHGTPGDGAQLVFGRQLAVVDVPNVVEDQLLVPIRTLSVGVFPASGELSRSVLMPSAWSVGQILVVQGRTTSPTGSVSLTHSLPITLR